MCRASSIIPYVGLLLILMLTMKLRSADAAIGYDCGNRIKNMTTISLLDIDDCDLKIDTVETSTEKITLLQLNEFDSVEISQCKVEISRTINHCGMFSHSSLVSAGLLSYIEKISREDCENALKYGSLKLKNIVVTEIPIGELEARPLIFAGTISDNGQCSGVHYEDPYGSWDDVTVTGTARITISSEKAKVKVKDNKIILPSGYSCKFSSEECIDPVSGYTFWHVVPRENCNPYTYSLLYKGEATKLKSNNETVYTVKVSDTSFSFTTSGFQSACNVTLQKTESPKLFIMNSNNLAHLDGIITGNIKVDNMNIFEYVNAKFVYVERHIRSQLNSLYEEVMKHTCKLEKEILKNTLAIAATQPDEFAFRYMESSGFMAVLAGEVVHIVQCVPAEVTFRHTDKCYNRLPIQRNNQSMFLMPRTHILTKYANEIPCNLPLVEQYKLEGKWYNIAPHRRHTDTPMKLKPSSKMTWKYVKPADLLASGLYTRGDLDLMQDRIMNGDNRELTMKKKPSDSNARRITLNPMETKVQTATLSQKITSGMKESVDMKSFLRDYVQNELFPDIWSLIWGPFSWFGSVAAGLVGVFMIFKMIKFVMDIFLNAYTAYSKYGWSCRILGSIWTSLNNLSLYQPEQRDQPKSDSIKLVKIKKI